MSVKSEITSIRNAIAAVLPTSKFHLAVMPKKHAAGNVVITMPRSRKETETAYHYRSNKTYQIVLFASSEINVLDSAEQVAEAFSQTDYIAQSDTERIIRIESFSLSEPFETETQGVFAIIGMLEAVTRTARTFDVVPLIEDVEMNVISQQDAASWGAVDGTFTFADMEEGITRYEPEGDGDPHTYGDIEDGILIKKKEDE